MQSDTKQTQWNTNSAPDQGAPVKVRGWLLKALIRLSQNTSRWIKAQDLYGAQIDARVEKMRREQMERTDRIQNRAMAML